jgi:hypothetical protein
MEMARVCGSSNLRASYTQAAISLSPSSLNSVLQALAPYSTMSATSTPNDSPIGASIQPLHNPSQAAQVVVPQAPLGNVVNQAPGMGAKALLAKKFAKAQ